MVKTITIMDDAYNMLKKNKSKEESFSDIIRKLTVKQKTDLTKWVGILNKEEYKNLNKEIKSIREETSKDLEKRFKKIKW